MQHGIALAATLLALSGAAVEAGIPIPSGFLRVGVGGATDASSKYQCR